MLRKLWMAAIATAPLWAQTAPTFEVATVKSVEMSKDMGGGIMRPGMTMDGSRVDLRVMSLADLITTAYRVKNYQVNGPDWIQSERYTIQAKIPDGVSKDQVPEMLQALLAERFKLTFRREQRDHNLYALIVGKDGLKLKEVEPDPIPAEGDDGGGGPRVFTNRMQLGGVGGGMGAKAAGIAGAGGGNTKPTGNGGIHFDQKMTMPRLADFLGRFVDRPVVDMTEAKGTYPIVLDVTIADLMRGANGGVQVRMMANGVPVESSQARQELEKMVDEQGGGNSVFAQLQKMGLKLEPRKAPLDFLIVEHAEKAPIEN